MEWDGNLVVRDEEGDHVVAGIENHGGSYLLPEEIARDLRVTRQTVYTLLKSGNGPRFVRVGAVIRVPVDEYQQWLEKCSQGGAA